MSLKTWKEEFYLVKPSKKMSTVESIEHSLRKWEGLTKSNLEKHGILKSDMVLIDGTRKFPVNSSTCALCENFLYSELGLCRACPIFQVNGKNCNGEFKVWVDGGNPNPMIRALKRALKAEMKNGN